MALATRCEGIRCWASGIGGEGGTLELSCCKKQQESPNKETDLGNKGCLKVLYDTKLVLNERESFMINLVSLSALACPLFPKPVS